MGGDPNAFAGDVPVLWNEGEITLLPELPGAVDTIPCSLDDSGQVVGSSTSPPPTPCLWQKGVMIELQTRIPADSGSHAAMPPVAPGEDDRRKVTAEPGGC